MALTRCLSLRFWRPAGRRDRAEKTSTNSPCRGFTLARTMSCLPWTTAREPASSWISRRSMQRTSVLTTGHPRSFFFRGEETIEGATTKVAWSLSEDHQLIYASDDHVAGQSPKCGLAPHHLYGVKLESLRWHPLSTDLVVPLDLCPQGHKIRQAWLGQSTGKGAARCLCCGHASPPAVRHNVASLADVSGVTHCCGECGDRQVEGPHPGLSTWPLR